MLTLTRKPGESIYLVGVQGYSLLEMKAVVREVRGRQVRIGVEAPDSIALYREEVYERIKPLIKALREDCRSAEEFERRSREYLRPASSRQMEERRSLDCEVF